MIDEDCSLSQRGGGRQWKSRVGRGRQNLRPPPWRPSTLLGEVHLSLDFTFGCDVKNPFDCSPKIRHTVSLLIVKLCNRVAREGDWSALRISTKEGICFVKNVGMRFQTTRRPASSVAPSALVLRRRQSPPRTAENRGDTPSTLIPYRLQPQRKSPTILSARFWSRSAVARYSGLSQ